ncbi:AGE family epimerase/isomerase [Maricaulis sp.]|uniref:AGE family epimerase/isomerase n=1 Tax=Maricaulis sp. TaxID=1486257 RepID=UPI0026100C14|nr:AGE family epimerase/isomerase [Maricaulis sp.]
MDGPSRLTEWGLKTCLPFWLDTGWDTVHGGFFECLDLDGRGIAEGRRRVRVQARQIYVQARCALSGFPANLDLARDGYELLRRRAFEQGGMPGWAHALDPRGEVIDERRDLYDHAFILLAQASLYRASGDRRYLADAQQLLAFLDARMKADGPGFIEAIGGPALPRRQNPHMHLFEALLALYEADPADETRQRLDALMALAQDVFIDRKAGVLREFFDSDWSAYPGDQGDTVEPGHLSEWVWLLAEYDRLCDDDHSTIGDSLFETARQHGVVARTGLMCAAMNSSWVHTDTSSRSWMQTERIRAAAVQVRLARPGAREELDIACARLFEHHLDAAIPGGWIDQVDGDGAPLSGKIPASTLYHVLGAIIEAEQIARPEDPTTLSMQSAQRDDRTEIPR